MDGLAAGVRDAPEPADPDSIRVARGAGTHPGDIPPDERAALLPTEAGVRVGLPGPTAAIAALAGGAVLLVQLVAALVK